MTTRTFRYCKETDRMVEVFRDEVPREPSGPTIMVDSYSSNPVRSPVDGSVLDSRRALRAHNDRHGVADVGSDLAFHPSRARDFQHWDRSATTKAVKEAVDKHDT